MLKAIRFDEDKHKDLLKWMKDFRDAKGKENESEAARYLMQMGFEYMIKRQDEVQAAAHPDPEPIQAVTESKADIDKDALKRELMDEVMVEINTKMLGGLTAFVDKLNNFQIQPQIITAPLLSVQSENQQHVDEKIIEKPKPRKKSIAAPIEGNALLANILGNADR